MSRRRIGFAFAASHAIVSLALAASASPELFAEGTISTRDDEFGIAFTPDGQTAFFTKRSPTTNTPPLSMICVSHRVDGRWSEPEIAPFSGRYNDFGITVAPDGSRILFSSDRPNGVDASAPPNFDIWVVERDGDAWREPRNLGAPINTPGPEAYPSLAADGTLYFASTRAGGKGGPDIYRARLVDGHYAEPENLADLNGATYDSQPVVAADQRFVVFASSDRADTIASAGAPYSRPDLYVSFRTANGFTPPRHLDAPINSPASDGMPSLSPDGKWLYFASDRNFSSLPMPKRLSGRDYTAKLRSTLDGWNNVYRVPISTIDALAPNAGAHAP